MVAGNGLVAVLGARIATVAELKTYKEGCDVVLLAYLVDVELQPVVFVVAPVLGKNYYLLNACEVGLAIVNNYAVLGPTPRVAVNASVA